MDINKRQAHGIAKLIIFALIALFALITHGADLSKGYSFSGTSPNNKVTPEKLNELVDSGRILTGFYTDKPEETNADSSDVFLFYDTASGSYRKITKGNLITNNVTGSTFRNLYISNIGTTTPTAEVQVTADEIVMRSLAGTARIAASVDITANITTTGLNGLDTGTVANHTWYYVWAVSDGTNDRVILSASQTSPTLPTGYQYRALVGVVRYDFGQLRLMSQRGRTVVMKPQTTDANGLSPGTPLVLQALPLLSHVPPNIVAAVRGTIGVVTSVNRQQWIATQGAGNVSTGAGLEDIGIQRFTQAGSAFSAGAGVDGMTSATSFICPIRTSQTIYWTAHTAGSENVIRITGFDLNL